MSVNMADILRSCIVDFLEFDVPVTLTVQIQEKLLEYVDELYSLAEPQAEKQRLNEKYGDKE